MTGTGGTVVLYRSVIFIEYKKWFLNIGPCAFSVWDGRETGKLLSDQREDVET